MALDTTHTSQSTALVNHSCAYIEVVGKPEIAGTV